MSRIIINKLGPIKYCELEIKDFMIFTGPQASGKSTIAKSIFFFKNIKKLLIDQINTMVFGSNNGKSMLMKIRLTKEIRSCFLQTFGTTWCMHNDMYLQYYYSDDVYIKISLKADNYNKHNYIWIKFSRKLSDFLNYCDTIDLDMMLNPTKHIEIREKINVVVAVIKNEEGKILIVQRNLKKSQGGLWEFPGGKIEVGESREAAIIREIMKGVLLNESFND